MQDIKACPNVVIDTSGAQPQAGLVEYAVRELGARRVLFGSDWPLRDFAAQRARVEGAGLSARDRALVLGGNAARLLPALRMPVGLRETRREACGAL